MIGTRRRIDMNAAECRRFASMLAASTVSGMMGRRSAARPAR
jgi:hypothetical protein